MAIMAESYRRGLSPGRGRHSLTLLRGAPPTKRTGLVAM